MNFGYIYNYVDHLGNVRLSYTRNGGILQIVEESNYYPFGLKHEGYNDTGYKNSNYNYKYNGKELQETGMYDYGVRMYMPDLGRWGVVDLLAEKMNRHSPYNYAFNNPLSFIDPDGRESKWIPTIEFDKNKNGELAGGHLSLQMEKGDTAQTLAKTLNIDQKEADKLFVGMQESGSSSIAVPESIAGPINEAITDAIVNSGDYNGSWLTDKNYNYFACAFRTGRDESLREDNFSYELSPGKFQSFLKAGFEKTDDKIFGKTIVAFRGTNKDGGKELNHSATYLGTSKNGMEYTFSKNGFFVNPKIEQTFVLKKQYGQSVSYWNKSK